MDSYCNDNLRGLKCDRVLGHDGLHLEVDVAAWVSGAPEQDVRWYRGVNRAQRGVYRTDAKHEQMKARA